MLIIESNLSVIIFCPDSDNSETGESTVNTAMMILMGLLLSLVGFAEIASQPGQELVTPVQETRPAGELAEAQRIHGDSQLRYAAFRNCQSAMASGIPGVALTNPLSVIEAPDQPPAVAFTRPMASGFFALNQEGNYYVNLYGIDRQISSQPGSAPRSQHVFALLLEDRNYGSRVLNSATGQITASDVEMSGTGIVGTRDGSPAYSREFSQRWEENVRQTLTRLPAHLNTLSGDDIDAVEQAVRRIYCECKHAAFLTDSEFRIMLTLLPTDFRQRFDGEAGLNCALAMAFNQNHKDWEF